MAVEDTATLERILRTYSGLARRLASSHEADREQARDLAQEILVAVWRAWPAFRGQCSERTYVARIAHNRIATHIARARRGLTLTGLSDELVAEGPTPEQSALGLDEFERLVSQVRRLPIAYREVAVLLLEGLPPAEIGATLGISANAVAIRASRAREMLRALLETRR
jgi:RNA polymerase sigma-70 factor (ECF subfamily)